MRRISLNIFIVFSFTLIAPNSVLLSQTEELTNNYNIAKDRTVGEHFFTPHDLIKSPYIITHLGTSLGLGQIRSINTLFFVVGENQYKYSQGEVLAAFLSLEYQHAVKEWLAVSMQFNLVGRLGSKLNTLLAYGINYATSFNIGWTIKAIRGKRFYLSTAFELNNGNYSTISVRQLVEDVINKTSEPTLFSSNNILNGTVGLRAAYGFTHFIGLEALANLGYGETVQKSLDNTWFYILGLNVDMNFTKIFQVPMSISVGYLHSSYPKGNNDIIYQNNIGVAQISYIGRSDIVLSLDLQSSREIYTGDGSTIWLNSLAFTMRYLF